MQSGFFYKIKYRLLQQKVLSIFMKCNAKKVRCSFFLNAFAMLCCTILAKFFYGKIMKKR